MSRDIPMQERKIADYLKQKMGCWLAWESLGHALAGPKIFLSTYD